MKLQVISAIVRKNLLTKIKAYPFSFFFAKFLTAFYLILSSNLIYKYVFKNQVSESFKIYTNGENYISFIVIGTFIYVFIMGTILNVSRSYITEMREGTFDSIIITPLNHRDYLLAYMVENIITTTFEIGIMILATLPFKPSGFIINYPSLILGLLISMIGFYGISIILSAVMIKLKDTYLSQNTLILSLSLLCGVSFPIQYLPKLVQKISYVIPLTYSLKILRNSLINGLSIENQLNNFYVFFLLSIFYLILGELIIKKTVKNAAENQFV